jgi:uncharacterized membrane protein YedE/YeeE
MDFSADGVWLGPLAGLLIGGVMGGVARAGRFCTLSALERWWYGGDSAPLRGWVLAAATALAATQAMTFAGWIDPGRSFYLDPGFGLTGAILGGLMFGFGMAMVGACGFSALVQLGGGSLKALVALIVLGIAALAAQKGLIAQLRVPLVDALAIDMTPLGGASLGGVASRLAGLDLRAATAVAATAGLLAWVFAEPGFRARPDLAAGGVAIGLCVAAGWLATTLVAEVAFAPVQIEAGSFVTPVGDLLMQVVAVTGTAPDYGVGLVVGVALGAAIVARLRRDVRWEACDDARELGRHVVGAALMGVGGVFAMGCTIGQGVTAVSALAISAPVVMASMAVGARLGLAWLIEGSMRHAFDALRGRPSAAE